MPDLLFLVLTVAFFAAATGLVVVCDRIIGPDAEHGDPQGVGDPDPADEGQPHDISATAAADLAVTRGAS